jgi:hypothetical protein
MAINLSNLKVVKIANKTVLNGKPLEILEITHKDGSMISRKELKAICNLRQKSMQAKFGGGIISVSIEYSNRWFSGDTSRLNEPINYFSLNDYEEYEEDPEEYISFRFMSIEQAAPAEGGVDINNDCLIKALKKSLGKHKNKYFLLPEELKEELGLERNDLIHINRMTEVEAYFNRKLKMKNDINSYSIFVSGDHQFTSSKTTNKKIHLILSNGHYTLDSSKFIIIHCKSYEEKPILMIDDVEGDFETYDGESKSVMSKEEKDVMIRNPLSQKYIAVIRNKLNKKMQGQCIEEAYENYIKMADTMKEHIGGRYNFYKCGSVKKMALHTFFESTKAVQPDDINNCEATWINDASSGALMYWEAYKGKVDEYDINSRYPHIMQKNQNYFPIREGQYLTLKEIDVKNVEYGIYRCTITKLDDRSYKFFRFNPKNTYTSIDVKVAVDYGLKIEMIQNGQPNFLYYSKDKLMNGAYLFKSFVDELFELKSQKVDGAKQILNTLWGGLTEKNYFDHTYDPNEEMHINDCNISKISYGNKLNIKCTYFNKPQFKTNWARIKPVILAYAREQMFYRFRSMESDIVYLHTDGFLMKDGHPEMFLSDKLGGLKYEGAFDVNIVGFNKKKSIISPNAK